FVHHHSPPVVLQVALQFDAERSVIPQAVQSAVNFARLENEAAPLAQADDLFHACRAVALRRRALGIRGRAQYFGTELTADYADVADNEATIIKTTGKEYIQ